jgi:SAM-dependent methyltransferase
MNSIPFALTLQKEYASRFAATTSYRISVWRKLITTFFSRWIPADCTVLDLGCGWGEFINHVHAKRRYGMDLNPDSRRKLSEDVTLLEQDSSVAWNLPDEHVDVVFTSNFFEHLPSKDHLRKTLDEAFRCLKPGGRIICMGPNVKFLAGRYWDFWDHLLPLTELSLKEGLELTGFATEFVTDRFLPYTMSQGPTVPVFLVGLYMRCPLLWRVFGKQFLVIAHKPQAHNLSRRAVETSGQGTLRFAEA